MTSSFPSRRGGRSWIAVLSYGSCVTFNFRLAKLTKFVLIVALSEMVGVSSAAVDVELRMLGRSIGRGTAVNVQPGDDQVLVSRLLFQVVHLRLQLGYTLIFCFHHLQQLGESLVCRFILFLGVVKRIAEETSKRRISSISDPVCFDAFEVGMMCGLVL